MIEDHQNAKTNQKFEFQDLSDILLDIKYPF